MTAALELAPLPAFAAWRFVDAVDGFEVVYPGPRRLRGCTSAVEDGRPYAIRYEISLDEHWRTRRACTSSSDTLERAASTVLVADGHGHWTVDGVEAPHLDGLLDVDLEASACTNTLPIHRLALPEREAVDGISGVRAGPGPVRDTPRPDVPAHRHNGRSTTPPPAVPSGAVLELRRRRPRSSATPGLAVRFA